MGIGRMIYFNKTTGEILLDKGETLDISRVTTFEEDYEMFKILNSIPIDLIGVKTLEYGEFREELEKSESVSVDVETEDLIFIPRPKLTFEEIAKLDELQIKAEKQIEIEVLQERLAKLIKITGIITPEQLRIEELENQLLLAEGII